MKIISFLFLFYTGLAYAEDRTSYFTVSWNSIPKYIQFCLAEPSVCPLSPFEKDLLTKISTNYSSEKPLVFTSEQERPGLFSKAGAHRIAVTGNNIGDPIYINKEELASVGIMDAIAILVHELGHHYQIPDTEDRVLDILGSKVKNYIQQRSESVNLKKFNQPHIELLSINSGIVSLNNRLGSDLIVFDNQAAYNISEMISQSMPCYLGYERTGSLILSQLRTKSITNWLPVSKRHHAIFELTLRENCTSPSTKDKQIIFAGIRLSLELNPINEEPRENWWKSSPASIAENGFSMLVSEAGMTQNDFVKDQGNLPLTISQIKSLQPKIKNDQTWQVNALVTIPFDYPIESCSGNLSSNDFVDVYNTPRYSLSFETCKLTKIAEKTYSLELQYHFPKSTPSRFYYVESLGLKIKGQDMEFRGFPDNLEMSSQASVQLESSDVPTPLKIQSATLINKEDNAQPVFISTNLTLQSHEIYTIPPKGIFGLAFYISSTSNFKPVSSIIGNYNWIKNGEKRNDEFESFVKNSLKDWNFPFGGSTQVVQHPKSNTTQIFQLSLRPLTTTQDFIHQMNYVQYSSLWLINENLQESYTELDFFIKTE